MRRHALLFAALLALFGVVLDLVSPSAVASFFKWPTGGVWSNLVASFILGVPAIYALFRRLARQHAEHIRLLHEHHAHLMEMMKDHGPS